METGSLDFVDDEEPTYESFLLPENKITSSENRLSPYHPSVINALSNIQDFVETTIVLRKNKRNELNISVTGGVNTYMEAVCVTEVHRDSSAYRDGRLRRGDVLLAVNEVSLRDVTYTEAVKLLREASSPVRLLVLRENPHLLFTTDEVPTKFLTVELWKSSVKDRLGLSFMQRTNGRGVFITYVHPGSIAAQHGRSVMQGDQILEINGQNVADCNQQQVAQMLQNMDAAIVLLIGRVPKLTASVQEWARKKAQYSSRTRTSTWSAYTGNTRDKLQVQRPSLPATKDSCAIEFSTPTTNTVGILRGDDSAILSRENSPNSSVHRCRLSVVGENKYLAVTGYPNDDEDYANQGVDDFKTNDSKSPLLPSIHVTSF
ncbi:ligand of Numb protein X 2-like [Tachypleus tridentatus]|uniref:ligand of Numb protein X 2-like n=1 Tax=Tachypleus tridentatus TaxID=6853 RepID=UPI003FD4C269